LAASNVSATDAAIWGGVLILAVVVLALAVWYLKRRLFSATIQEDEPNFFSLQHLRKMLAEGQITPEEFERLKVSALEAARSARTGKTSGSASSQTGPSSGANGVK
jgi:hypothetical protein